MNNDSAFQKFAGVLAILAGISGFCYSLSFIVIARNSPELGASLSAFFLTLGGLLTGGVLVGLYKRLEPGDSGFALWALVLGIGAALGASAHGGYDLANAFNPPAANVPALADLPNQVDPRGLMTFGVAGMSTIIFSLVIVRGGMLPKTLGYLGYLLGILLIVVYLGRLIILDATNAAIVIPALLTGFVINPLWYIWLGLQLRQ
ncbi:MAG: hypothetical protein IT319_07080 [Anaerolineae bacterium]|nr:hypothetical protein [Anaerolineae bacterium]